MKTSKDKAKELVEKFENSVLDSRSQDGCLLLLRKEAIECAKIAVDEIIDLGILSNGWQEGIDLPNTKRMLPYWQEVKNELNKML